MTARRPWEAHARWLVCAVLTLGCAVAGHAQSRPYVGGSVSVIRETRSETFQPGGTAWGGSLLLGVSVSPRLSVDFEPLFTGSLDEGQYTYSASPSLRARVNTRRRDSFFTFQLRARAGTLEPVIGISYVYSRASRHATLVETGLPYFDDRQSQRGLALASGIDGKFMLTSRVFIIPTFRAFLISRSTDGLIGEQTSGGPFAFRYGVGTRVAF